MAAPLSAGTIWDESINGELSLNSNAPTDIGTLIVGDNLVIGSLVGDQDDFRFFVPAGATLNGIIVNSQTGSGSPNFFVIRGTTFSGNPQIVTLNWGTSSVSAGDNLLTKGGLTSLASGNYEIVFTGFGANLSAYTLNLLVTPTAAAAPEPAELLLLPLALGGVLLTRRFGRKPAL